MTKSEKAQAIIDQNGKCGGVDCSEGKDDECPCLKECVKVNGTNMAHPEKVVACKKYLGIIIPAAIMQKSLRDEFAMAVLSGMYAGGANWNEVESISRVALRQADAMMAERKKIKEDK